MRSSSDAASSTQRDLRRDTGPRAAPAPARRSAACRGCGAAAPRPRAAASARSGSARRPSIDPRPAARSRPPRRDSRKDRRADPTPCARTRSADSRARTSPTVSLAERRRAAGASARTRGRARRTRARCPCRRSPRPPTRGTASAAAPSRRAPASSRTRPRALPTATRTRDSAATAAAAGAPRPAACARHAGQRRRRAHAARATPGSNLRRARRRRRQFGGAGHPREPGQARPARLWPTAARAAPRASRCRGSTASSSRSRRRTDFRALRLLRAPWLRRARARRRRSAASSRRRRGCAPRSESEQRIGLQAMRHVRAHRRGAMRGGDRLGDRGLGLDRRARRLGARRLVGVAVLADHAREPPQVRRRSRRPRARATARRGACDTRAGASFSCSSIVCALAAEQLDALLGGLRALDQRRVDGDEIGPRARFRRQPLERGARIIAIRRPRERGEHVGDRSLSDRRRARRAVARGADRYRRARRASSP